MTDSPSAEDLVALQDTLYDSRNPTRRWLHRSRRAYIEEAIEAAGPGQSALEVGPGSGVYLPALQRSFVEVTAADIERPGQMSETLLRHQTRFVLGHSTSARRVWSALTHS